jgi:ABC-type uncharacterized transport system permease subunit
MSLAFDDKNHRSVHKDIMDFKIDILDLWFSILISCLALVLLLNEIPKLSGWGWEAGKR